MDIEMMIEKVKVDGTMDPWLRALCTLILTAKNCKHMHNQIHTDRDVANMYYKTALEIANASGVQVQTVLMYASIIYYHDISKFYWAVLHILNKEDIRYVDIAILAERMQTTPSKQIKIHNQNRSVAEVFAQLCYIFNETIPKYKYCMSTTLLYDAIIGMKVEYIRSIQCEGKKIVKTCDITEAKRYGFANLVRESEIYNKATGQQLYIIPDTSRRN